MELVFNAAVVMNGVGQGIRFVHYLVPFSFASSATQPPLCFESSPDRFSLFLPLQNSNYHAQIITSEKDPHS